MLFGNNYKKETKAFMENFTVLFNIMKPIGFKKGDVTEAIYAMYLVCDYAAKDSGKDRKKLGLAIIQKANSSIWKLDYDEMIERVGIYEDALEKNILRGEGMQPVMKEMFAVDTASRIGIILSDMLYNPACKYDYLGAEYEKYDADQVEGFSMKVAAPIIGIMGKLYKQIVQ